MNIYDLALWSQGACNLRGLLNDVPRFTQAVLDEIASGEWTGSFEEHPVIISASRADLLPDWQWTALRPSLCIL